MLRPNNNNAPTTIRYASLGRLFIQASVALGDEHASTTNWYAIPEDAGKTLQVRKEEGAHPWKVFAMCPALRGFTVSYAGVAHFPKHSFEYSLNF